MHLVGADSFFKRLFLLPQSPLHPLKFRATRIEIEPVEQFGMDRWSRILKSLYRKEPILSFVVTIGAVNLGIGGVSEHWSLMAVGGGAVGVGLALRWWQLSQRKASKPEFAERRSPVYVLPPSSEGDNLPMLSIPKKKSPRR